MYYNIPAVVCRRAHVLCTLFVFVYVWWCPTHIVLCFCVLFVFVFQILPVSLDYPFLIAPSVFSNVYLLDRQCDMAKTTTVKTYVKSSLIPVQTLISSLGVATIGAILNLKCIY
jgi:hypothetical protein